MPHKYDALGAALRASAGPPPPPEKPKKRGGWRKWLVVYLWLSAIAGIWQLAFGTDEKPAPAEAAVPAAVVDDTVASPPPAALAAPAPELPVVTPVVDEAPPVAKPQKSITVYTTRTGSKYHRSGCSSLRKSSSATTLSEALSWGYEPCGRCRPPR